MPPRCLHDLFPLPPLSSRFLDPVLTRPTFLSPMSVSGHGLAVVYRGSSVPRDFSMLSCAAEYALVLDEIRAFEGASGCFPYLAVCFALTKEEGWAPEEF